MDINRKENEENVSKKRSRKRSGESRGFDFLVALLTTCTIISILSYAVFMTVHTKIDLNKNEKGEISVIIDYDKENEVVTPGQNILPMLKEVLQVLKDRM
jgi:hypothetical protein